MAEHLQDIATWRVEWLSTLSDDEKAKLQADRAEWLAEETKAARMAEMAATFQTADTNADGVLNQAEFNSFLEMMQSNTIAKGVPAMNYADVEEAMKDKLFAFYDAVGEAPGVTLADFGAGMNQFAAAIKAKMA